MTQTVEPDPYLNNRESILSLKKNSLFAKDIFWGKKHILCNAREPA